MALQTLETPRRRSLRFSSFDEIVADAQRARDQGYVQLGNWSLGKALAHLAAGMDASIDGVPFPTSLRTRILGRLVYRYVILYWRFPPGARLPRETAKILVPQNDTDFDEAMRSLRRGIERLATETRRFAHPVVGRMSIAQWNRFHFRHAELHLSFFVPAGSMKRDGQAHGAVLRSCPCEPSSSSTEASPPMKDHRHATIRLMPVCVLSNHVRCRDAG